MKHLKKRISKKQGIKQEYLLIFDDFYVNLVNTKRVRKKLCRVKKSNHEGDTNNSIESWMIWRK